MTLYVSNKILLDYFFNRLLLKSNWYNTDFINWLFIGKTKPDNELPGLLLLQHGFKKLNGTYTF